jgi:hypothetical protein
MNLTTTGFLGNVAMDPRAVCVQATRPLSWQFWPRSCTLIL